jgi:hypothetical protein
MQSTQPAAGIDPAFQELIARAEMLGKCLHERLYGQTFTPSELLTRLQEQNACGARGRGLPAPLHWTLCDVVERVYDLATAAAVHKQAAREAVSIAQNAVAQAAVSEAAVADFITRMDVSVDEFITRMDAQVRAGMARLEENQVQSRAGLYVVKG